MVGVLAVCRAAQIAKHCVGWSWISCWFSGGVSAKAAVVNRGHARTVLVTGASIAGPALAYWLMKYGFDVTLVERAPTIRTGGYAIDIRGTATDAVDRMGILPAVRAEHVATRQVTFVNAKGRQVARVKLEDLAPGGGDRHVELARGALTSQPFELIRSQVKHRNWSRYTSPIRSWKDPRRSCVQSLDQFQLSCFQDRRHRQWRQDLRDCRSRLCQSRSRCPRATRGHRVSVGTPLRRSRNLRQSARDGAGGAHAVANDETSRSLAIATAESKMRPTRDVGQEQNLDDASKCSRATTTRNSLTRQ